ncbi:MAG TPA: hypothetical protein VMV69_20145 [Pirellulales bacterium]|nr:hypothetical protein [Pirellulales bacterium]
MADEALDRLRLVGDLAIAGSLRIKRNDHKAPLQPGETRLALFIGITDEAIRRARPVDS